MQFCLRENYTAVLRWMACHELNFAGRPLIKEINENKFLNATGQHMNTGVIK